MLYLKVEFEAEEKWLPIRYRGERVICLLFKISMTTSKGGIEERITVASWQVKVVREDAFKF